MFIDNENKINKSGNWHTVEDSESHCVDSLGKVFTIWLESVFVSDVGDGVSTAFLVSPGVATTDNVGWRFSSGNGSQFTGFFFLLTVRQFVAVAVVVESGVIILVGFYDSHLTLGSSYCYGHEGKQGDDLFFINNFISFFFFFINFII